MSDPTPTPGWTNTYETALKIANKWLGTMRDEGIQGVRLVDESEEERNVAAGKWSFTFKHAVTGTEVKFETHGIDNVTLYTRVNVFSPRQYWNGSSIAEPEAKDFAAPGFRMATRFEEVPDA
jgi:hypothetical protein